MSTRAAAATNGQSAATEADRTVHRLVCLAARPGESWTDRCTCGHLRLRHQDATHKPISTGVGRTCSGRNLAGACRSDCGCPRFTLAKEATLA